MSLFVLKPFDQNLIASFEEAFSVKAEQLDSLDSLAKDQAAILCIDQESFHDIEKLKQLSSEYPLLSIVLLSTSMNLPESLEEGKVYLFNKDLAQSNLSLLVELTRQDAQVQVNDEMSKMQKEYRCSIFLKLYTLKSLIESYSNTANKEELENIKKIVHKMAGSSGLYGYSATSSYCKEAEKTLQSHLEKGETVSKEQLLEHLSSIEKTYFQVDEIEKAKPTEEAPLPQQPQSEHKQPPSAEVTTSVELFLVDDDESILKLIETEAKKLGISIEVESSFEKAKQRLSDPNFEPTFLLIDLYSENESLTGYDLIDAYKSIKQTSSSFIAVLSAKGELSERSKASELGVDVYFEKPIAPDLLLYQIQKYQELKVSDSGKILLVDDDVDFCKFVESALLDSKYIIRTLSDPSNFFHELQQTAPDILILDLNMPNISGLDLLKAVRADYRYRKLPVIILTASDEIDTLKQAYELIIEDYIVKPITAEKFKATLSSIFKKQRAYEIIYEKDENLGIYTKQALLQNFQTYSLNYRSFSIITLAFHSTSSATFEPTQQKQISKIIADFFSQRDILGLWKDQVYVLIITHLLAKQLKVIVENLFTHIKSSKILNDSECGFNAILSIFPDDGDSLEEIMGKALSHPSISKPDKLWSISTSETSQVSLELLGYQSISLITGNPILKDLISYALELRGYSIISLESGKDALGYLSQNFLKNPPDLILLDEEIKDDNPIVLLEKIKSLIGERIPVILLSEKSREGDIIEGLTRGATSYVTKPFSLSLLIQRIEQRNK